MKEGFNVFVSIQEKEADKEMGRRKRKRQEN